MARYGYARISTRSQRDDSQLDALTDAGCERIWPDVASGRLARRPGWDACLDHGTVLTAAAACPACGHQPASRPEALRQREDLAIVWLHQDSPSGPISQHRHCASCQPHIECGTVECAHCGDGPILTGALVDQLRKQDPNQPTALRAWLTSHGWQLEPEPLCPAHSNSTKD